MASQEVVVAPVPGKNDFRFDFVVEGLVDEGVVEVVVAVVVGSGMT